MIKYIKEDTMVVFSEIPTEISLAINISNCQNNCIGCHSPYLRKDVGETLNIDVIDELIEKNKGVTCFLFMGEGNDIGNLCNFSKYIKEKYGLLTALYSGKQKIEQYMVDNFDYIKIGPYMEEFGPLNKKTTNQRLYKIIKPDNKIDDITYMFWK